MYFWVSIIIHQKLEYFLISTAHLNTKLFYNATILLYWNKFEFCGDPNLCSGFPTPPDPPVQVFFSISCRQKKKKKGNSLRSHLRPYQSCSSPKDIHEGIDPTVFSQANIYNDLPGIFVIKQTFTFFLIWDTIKPNCSKSLQKGSTIYLQPLFHTHFWS